MRAAVWVLLCLASLVAGCDEHDVRYDMARFDRAYIPALTLTASKDVTGMSILAVKRLKQDWEVLKIKNAAVLVPNGIATTVDGVLDRADMNITIGNFSATHNDLKEIRQLLYDARQKQQIDYFLDHLTVFQAQLDKVLKPIEGSAPEDISTKDIEAIARELPEAKRRWDVLMRAEFDRSVFLFSNEMEEALIALIKEEYRNIGDFQAALLSGNRKLIAKHALLIRQGYDSVFRMFGNYESVSL